jgi:hypothetical protein
VTRGNGLPLAIFSRGVAFDLKWRRRRAALTSDGISPAAWWARANAEARGGGSRRQRCWTCSRPLTIRTSARQIPGLGGARAVPLPRSGRTHLAVRLTVGDPRLLARFWPENGKRRGHVYLEIRMSARK